jgi:hypothetical protein
MSSDYLNIDAIMSAIKAMEWRPHTIRVISTDSGLRDFFFRASGFQMRPTNHYGLLGRNVNYVFMFILPVTVKLLVTRFSLLELSGCLRRFFSAMFRTIRAHNAAGHWRRRFRLQAIPRVWELDLRTRFKRSWSMNLRLGQVGIRRVRL